jgi:uncharacterized Zn finger protein
MNAIPPNILRSVTSPREINSGQVLELEIEPGIALAKVQGSRYTPYRVRVRGKPLSDHQWHRAERALAAQALPLAQLLARAAERRALGE